MMVPHISSRKTLLTTSCVIVFRARTRLRGRDNDYAWERIINLCRRYTFRKTPMVPYIFLHEARVVFSLLWIKASVLSREIQYTSTFRAAMWTKWHMFGNDVLHRGCVNTEKKITTITIIINLFPLDLSHHNHDPNIQNIENVIHVVLWVYPIVSLVVALDSFWSWKVSCIPNFL